jgi:hypothetical protein
VQGEFGLAKLRLKQAMAAIKEQKPLLVGDLEVGGWVGGWVGGCPALAVCPILVACVQQQAVCGSAVLLPLAALPLPMHVC